eukprot:GDKI01046050.1.p1 GENE.GDKI01046050.1~~GDKI01046050.1.p1  ORF type:complete len:179 (-),score=34.68 GDKI01046050.1:168-704(-)
MAGLVVTCTGMSADSLRPTQLSHATCVCVQVVPRSESGMLSVGVFVAELTRELQHGEEVETLWPADSTIRGGVTLEIQVDVGFIDSFKICHCASHRYTACAYRTFTPDSNLQWVELTVSAPQATLKNVVQTCWGEDALESLCVSHVTDHEVALYVRVNPSSWQHGASGVQVVERPRWD